MTTWIATASFAIKYSFLPPPLRPSCHCKRHSPVCGPDPTGQQSAVPTNILLVTFLGEMFETFDTLIKACDVSSCIIEPV